MSNNGDLPKNEPFDPLLRSHYDTIGLIIHVGFELGFGIGAAKPAIPIRSRRHPPKRPTSLPFLNLHKNPTVILYPNILRRSSAPQQAGAPPPRTPQRVLPRRLLIHRQQRRQSFFSWKTLLLLPRIQRIPILIRSFRSQLSPSHTPCGPRRQIPQRRFGSDGAG